MTDKVIGFLIGVVLSIPLFFAFDKLATHLALRIYNQCLNNERVVLKVEAKLDDWRI